MKRPNLSYSNQTYLNSIYRIRRQKKHVREIDLANDLQVTKPSVTRAMQHFADQGLIEKEIGKEIRLTDLGGKTAESFHHRCSLVKEFFSGAIGEWHRLSDREAGQIAYSMSDEAIDAVQTYLIKIQAKKIEKVETAV